MEVMRLDALDAWFRSVLDPATVSGIDSSLNGLQVDRRNREILRVACAVDACMESFRRAAAANADLLFVHHGLFWGPNVAVRRSHYERLRFLIEHDLALYAMHLPLDLDPLLGNNARMAMRLGLLDIEPFGAYKGLRIGVKGRFDRPVTIDDVPVMLGFDPDASLAVLPFGTKDIRTVGIVSGGGTHEVDQAVADDLDLYITGDASHTMYHYCLEESINLLCGGHYQTETFGVQAVAEYLSSETGIETVFIDVPTGL
jgi:dinuclear metal center YbgI/SA1388 family protein